MKTNKKTKKVTVRFSESEYKQYLLLLEFCKSDYSQSEFIRDCIFKTVPPKLIVKQATIYKPSICDKERVRQIVGLSNNINQIARNLNILMKSSNQSKLLSYLQELDAIHSYCESALYEKNE